MITNSSYTNDYKNIYEDEYDIYGVFLLITNSSYANDYKNIYEDEYDLQLCI